MMQILQLSVNGLAAGCIYGLIALGFILIYKATETLNFAQGDLMMLGAFIAVSLTVTLGLNYWLALLLAALAMALFCYLLDALILRRVIGQPQFSVVMLTLGLGFVMRLAAGMIWGSSPLTLPTPFSVGVLRIGSLVISYVNAAAIVGTAILCAVLYAFFRLTRVGVAMQAASQNQLAAYYMGVPVPRINSLIWAISGAVAAVGGILLAPLTLVDTSIGQLGMKAFCAAVMGGFTSIPGALVGGVLIGVIEQLASVYIASGAKEIAAYVVLLLVLLLMPRGLSSAARGKRV